MRDPEAAREAARAAQHERIAALVGTAPPLSNSQKDRLRGLLALSKREDDPDDAEQLMADFRAFPANPALDEMLARNE